MEIQAHMSAAPAALRQLSAKDLADLAAILDKLESPPMVGLWPKAAFRNEH